MPGFVTRRLSRRPGEGRDPAAGRGVVRGVQRRALDNGRGVWIPDRARYARLSGTTAEMESPRNESRLLFLPDRT
jgi:hypothetical protein